jgi:hypothetical protein
MFTPEEMNELKFIASIPNIYRFQCKFWQVSAPFRKFHENSPNKPKWMNTYDICEQYEGFRDETIKRKVGIPRADKLELVQLLKIALFELGNPLNTRWYSTMPPNLFYYVLDKRLAR